MGKNKYPLLYKINSPDDLRRMPLRDMPALCAEIRAFLIEKVTEHGGHLASNLGVVELSVALHRVFDTPKDRLIFDVGHQSYVHKLLTGRRDEFDTLRTPGGLSGFTKRSESEYDPFGAGHSSTSVSAALGFAEADRIAGRDNFTVAVIGDGALTGGLAYEALNNCDKNLRLIIVLNENEMSISRNIGGFANYIARIRSTPRYLETKQRTKSTVVRIPLVGNGLYNIMRDTKQSLKNMMYKSNFFEDLGLYYIGPADGNDYFTTERLLREAKNKGESAIVHLKTKKGCGYPPAESNPDKYHSVAPAGSPHPRNFSAEAGKILLEAARADGRICAVTASMCESTGLSAFRSAFPGRFFDVGIAEEHALTFCAGLAAAGMKPVFAVYSSFLQRGYDSLLHDIALQGLPVVLFVDRAGMSSGDGPTHHGVFDVSFMSSIPGIKIYSPATLRTLHASVQEALADGCPAAVRYSNCGEDENIKRAFFGDGRTAGELSPRPDFAAGEKKKALIITYGRIASEALRAEDMLAAEKISCGCILLTRLRPYGQTADEAAEIIAGSEAHHIVFLEEGIRNGGAGMLIKDELLTHHSGIMKNRTFDIMAIDDRFVNGIAGESLYKTAHISAGDAAQTVIAAVCAGKKKKES